MITYGYSIDSAFVEKTILPSLDYIDIFVKKYILLDQFINVLSCFNITQPGLWEFYAKSFFPLWFIIGD